MTTKLTVKATSGRATVTRDSRTGSFNGSASIQTARAAGTVGMDALLRRLDRQARANNEAADRILRKLG